MKMIYKRKSHVIRGFFISIEEITPLVVFLVLVLCLEEVKVTECCCESYQHGDDGDKSTCSVSYVLFEHDLFCFRTNL